MLCFSTAEASHLLAACRAQSQTITSLFNAIVALAFLSSQSTYALQELRKCSSFYLPFASVDQRSRVRPEYGGPDDYLAFAVSTFAVELDIRTLLHALEHRKHTGGACSYNLAWDLALAAKRQLGEQKVCISFRPSTATLIPRTGIRRRSAPRTRVLPVLDRLNISASWTQRL